MKLFEYQAKLVKENINAFVDTVHDTVYGAFCKGIEYALNHLWIPVGEGGAMPEDFEELISEPGKTKHLTCKFLDDSGKEKLGLFYREKSEEGWIWKSSHSGLPVAVEVIKWKNV